jgi:hypothetical protein
MDFAFRTIQAPLGVAEHWLRVHGSRVAVARNAAGNVPRRCRVVPYTAEECARGGVVPSV